MSAEFGKTFPALAHLVIHRVRFRGSAGPLHPFLTVRQNEHRLVVGLPDSPRNDPRQAFMHTGQIDHQHLLARSTLVHNLFCQFHAVRRHAFALRVQLHEFFCNFSCISLIFLQEKIQCDFGCLQPPTGVDAGTKHKSDVV